MFFWFQLKTKVISMCTKETEQTPFFLQSLNSFVFRLTECFCPSKSNQWSSIENIYIYRIYTSLSLSLSLAHLRAFGSSTRSQSFKTGSRATGSTWFALQGTIPGPSRQCCEWRRCWRWFFPKGREFLLVTLPYRHPNTVPPQKVL